MKLKTDIEILQEAYEVFDQKKEVYEFLNVSKMMLNNYEKGRYNLPFTRKLRLIKETKKRLKMLQEK